MILACESKATMKNSRDGVKLTIQEFGPETLVKVTSTNRGTTAISIGHSVSNGLEEAKKVYMQAFDELIEKVKKIER